MNILIVANEFPYPPNHGGRVDIYNRIRAFKNNGHKVFLITWQGIKKGSIPTDDEIKILEQSLDKLIVLDILRNWIRILSLLKYPSLVGARMISKNKYGEILLECRKFSPDFVFVDGIYGALIGQKLKKDLCIPLAVRLHNIESLYMKGQLSLAHGFKERLLLFLACLHLKQYEETVISKSDVFFDISIEDLDYWKDKGYKHGHWLPTVLPQFQSNKKSNVDSRIYKYDLGFLGNLNTPNNVNGLKWFIDEVLPLVINDYPNLKMILLGSEPNQEILEICAKNKQILLVKNPKDPSVYLDDVKVLINPVKFGSGVNIKSVEMLMRDNEVVSTSVGVKGMPKEISEVFFIADTPEQFSLHINNILLLGHFKTQKSRENLRELFREKSVNIVSNVIRKLI